MKNMKKVKFNPMQWGFYQPKKYIHKVPVNSLDHYQTKLQAIVDKGLALM